MTSCEHFVQTSNVDHDQKCKDASVDTVVSSVDAVVSSVDAVVSSVDAVVSSVDAVVSGCA